MHELKVFFSINTELMAFVIAFEHKRRPTFSVLGNLILYIGNNTPKTQVLINMLFKAFQSIEPGVTEILHLKLIIIQRMPGNINPYNLPLLGKLFHSAPFLTWRYNRFRYLHLAGLTKKAYLR